MFRFLRGPVVPRAAGRPGLLWERFGRGVSVFLTDKRGFNCFWGSLWVWFIGVHVLLSLWPGLILVGCAAAAGLTY